MMRILLALFALVAIVVAQSVPRTTIENQKLFVDGKEFWIKGVGYEPTPLGLNTTGGYCSLKATVYGEYRSACFDSDYAFGSSEPNRNPPGPPGPWFQALWERDFAFIKELGINTLRLYSVNPVTYQASQDSTLYPRPFGNNHIPFLDAAHAAGLKVIWPLVGDQSQLQGSNEATIKQLLSQLIDEVGNHPAVLMYIFGNELPIQSGNDLLALINYYIPFHPRLSKQKVGKTNAHHKLCRRLSTFIQRLFRDLNVDVFCTNAGYRGFTFTDLWSGDNNRTHEGLYKLGCKYNKPVFIGEWGQESLNNEITTRVPNWFNQQYGALVESTKYGCIGGSFFEFNDEPSKAAANQQTMGLLRPEVSFVSGNSGPNSTTPNVFLTDTFVRKPAVYEAARAGTWNGKAYNFNSDVFSLLGRPAETAGSSESVCAAIGEEHPTTFPGQSSSSSTAGTVAPTQSTSANPTSANPTTSASTSGQQTTKTLSTTETSATNPTSSSATSETTTPQTTEATPTTEGSCNSDGVCTGENAATSSAASTNTQTTETQTPTDTTSVAQSTNPSTQAPPTTNNGSGASAMTVAIALIFSLLFLLF